MVLYRKEYINHEKSIRRFILLVLIFVFSILLLIIRPNLIRILLGWDGLGLVSYCLVIYYQNNKSYNAGILTALSNRIGDVAILLSIAIILNMGGWNFIFYIESLKNNVEIKFVVSLIFLAALTKRAQIPFSSWLPAAIAAPTPVSALVHSSTLVTAGVYLLIRFSESIINSLFSQILTVIGALTIFISGLGANFEFDLKKIIALSTLSQLGLIIVVLSLGFKQLAMFHLLTHAIFKALLFICAGSIIHNIINSQDIRTMGSLIINMPVTSSLFNIANLSLCGIPFIAGFYSKDLILEIVSLSYLNLIIYLLIFLSTGLTVSYSFRLIYYSIIVEPNVLRINPINDEGRLITKSKIMLVIISILAGPMLRWIIFPCPRMICLPFFIKILTLIVCISGALIGYLLCLTNYLSLNKSFLSSKLTWFLSRIWFIPIISTIIIISNPLNIRMNIKIIDQGWREVFGSSKLFMYLSKLRKIYQLIHSNKIKLYITSIFFFVIAFVISVVK